MSKYGLKMYGANSCDLFVTGLECQRLIAMRSYYLPTSLSKFVVVFIKWLVNTNSCCLDPQFSVKFILFTYFGLRHVSVQLCINPDLTQEGENDVSVVETVSTIEDDPTFTSVPFTNSVPPTTDQISSDEDVPQSVFAYEKGIKCKEKDSNF